MHPSWILLFTLSLGGCDRLLPLAAGPGGTGQDAEPSTGDIAADVPRLDAGPRDRAIDHDQARPADQHPPEGSPPDQTAPADAASPTDIPPAGAQCAAGATPIIVGSWTDMVICKNATTAVTQCTAHTLCSGWTLCTAKQYRQSGGAIVFPGGTTAWIRSCIRQNSVMSGPTDDLCTTDCSPPVKVTQPVDTAWDCVYQNPIATSSAPNVGVAAATACSQVGSKTPSAEARWLPRDVHETLNAAVCCKP